MSPGPWTEIPSVPQLFRHGAGPAGDWSAAGRSRVRSSAPVGPLNMNAWPWFLRHPAGTGLASPHPAGASLFDAPTMMSARPSPLTSPARPILEPNRALLSALPCGKGLSSV